MKTLSLAAIVLVLASCASPGEVPCSHVDFAPAEDPCTGADKIRAEAKAAEVDLRARQAEFDLSPTEKNAQRLAGAKGWVAQLAVDLAALASDCDATRDAP